MSHHPNKTGFSIHNHREALLDEPMLGVLKKCLRSASQSYRYYLRQRNPHRVTCSDAFDQKYQAHTWFSGFYHSSTNVFYQSVRDLLDDALSLNQYPQSFATVQCLLDSFLNHPDLLVRGVAKEDLLPQLQFEVRTLIEGRGFRTTLNPELFFDRVKRLLTYGYDSDESNRQWCDMLSLGPNERVFKRSDNSGAWWRYVIPYLDVQSHSHPFSDQPITESLKLEMDAYRRQWAGEISQYSRPGRNAFSHLVHTFSSDFLQTCFNSQTDQFSKIDRLIDGTDQDFKHLTFSVSGDFCSMLRRVFTEQEQTSYSDAFFKTRASISASIIECTPQMSLFGSYLYLADQGWFRERISHCKNFDPIAHLPISVFVDSLVDYCAHHFSDYQKMDWIKNPQNLFADVEETWEPRMQFFHDFFSIFEREVEHRHLLKFLNRPDGLTPKKIKNHHSL